MKGLYLQLLRVKESWRTYQVTSFANAFLLFQAKKINQWRRHSISSSISSISENSRTTKITWKKNGTGGLWNGYLHEQRWTWSRTMFAYSPTNSGTKGWVMKSGHWIWSDIPTTFIKFGKVTDSSRDTFPPSVQVAYPTFSAYSRYPWRYNSRKHNVATD